MKPESSEPNSNIQGIGCLFVFIGIVAALFGLGGLLGIIENLELEFFGIELNDRRGRIYWVVGSVVCILIGVLLARKKT